MGGNKLKCAAHFSSVRAVVGCEARGIFVSHPFAGVGELRQLRQAPKPVCVSVSLFEAKFSY